MQKKDDGHHHIINKNQVDTRKNGPNSHHPLVEAEIDGVHMGVLGDGSPFMGLRGLARMCGIDHSGLLRFANNWGDEVSKPRGKVILRLILEQGHPGDLLYTRFVGKYGDTHAFPDAVCMAILEYYAFEAGANSTDDAKRNFRILARKSFRDFIYQSCGYDPANAVPSLWQPFHDRASLLHNTVPEGYFGVFHAIHDLFITLGQNGLHTDQSFVPDISVGMAWSKHWLSISGDELYGARIRYEHDYPSSYAQAKSNPQEPWAYPEMALGAFKKWFREDYIKGGRLTGYLSSQVKKKDLPAPFANAALTAFGLPANAPRIEQRKRIA